MSIHQPAFRAADVPTPEHLRHAYDSPIAKLLANAKPFDGPPHSGFAPARADAAAACQTLVAIDGQTIAVAGIPIPEHLRQAYDSPIAKLLANAKPLFDGPPHTAFAPETALDRGDK